MKHTFLYYFLFGLLSIQSIAEAASSFSVNSHSCQIRQGKTEPFILVLKKGEEIHSAILRCASDAKLNSALISGLGAVETATLRYFNHAAKAYQDKRFENYREVVSMPGNITSLDGQLYAHIHISLSDQNYQMAGGHLKEGIVGATLEVSIVPMKNKLFRKMNEEVGLNVIQTN